MLLNMKWRERELLGISDVPGLSDWPKLNTRRDSTGSFSIDL